MPPCTAHAPAARASALDGVHGRGGETAGDDRLGVDAVVQPAAERCDAVRAARCGHDEDAGAGGGRPGQLHRPAPGPRWPWTRSTASGARRSALLRITTWRSRRGIQRRRKSSWRSRVGVLLGVGHPRDRVDARQQLLHHRPVPGLDRVDVGQVEDHDARPAPASSCSGGRRRPAGPAAVRTRRRAVVATQATGWPVVGRRAPPADASPASALSSVDLPTPVPPTSASDVGIGRDPEPFARLRRGRTRRARCRGRGRGGARSHRRAREAASMPLASRRTAARRRAARRDRS